jgi:hypothetical protein
MSTIGNIWSCQKGPSVVIGCGGLVRVATPHNLIHKSIMRVDYVSTPFLQDVLGGQDYACQPDRHPRQSTRLRDGCHQQQQCVGHLVL